MSQFLKSKPMAAVALAGGLMLGGFGTLSAASAQTADEEAPTTATETDDSSDRGGRRHDGRSCGPSLDAAAEAIGIEVDALRAALDEGQSIAEVAESNGTDADAVVDAMIAATEAELDAKVEEGRLTEDEAGEKLAAKSERIEAHVAGEELPERSGRNNRGTDADADTDTDTDTDEASEAGEGS